MSESHYLVTVWNPPYASDAMDEDLAGRIDWAGRAQAGQRPPGRRFRDNSAGFQDEGIRELACGNHDPGERQSQLPPRAGQEELTPGEAGPSGLLLEPVHEEGDSHRGRGKEKAPGPWPRGTRETAVFGGDSPSTVKPEEPEGKPKARGFPSGCLAAIGDKLPRFAGRPHGPVGLVMISNGKEGG